MLLLEYFSAFDKRIQLDTSRRERIVSAQSAFEHYVANDEELSAALDPEPFLQGSVATGTAIRPLGSTEFDVDIVYPFRLAAFGRPAPSANQIVEWFSGRLKLSRFYASNLIVKPRCVRIDYAGDFHLDLIPAAVDVSAPFLAVPRKSGSGWDDTNPAGFADWIEYIDGRSGAPNSDGHGRFVRTLRLLKRWRDLHLTLEERPSSILFATMLGYHDPTIESFTPPLENALFHRFPSDQTYLMDMIRLTHSCYLNPPATGPFANPSLRTEDLSRGWHEKHLNRFLEELGKCISALYAGLLAEEETESVRIYKELLGNDFPSVQ